MLPGEEGVLSLRAYHHTAPERRPAGPGVEFRQNTPWRRWQVSFDGFGLHTPVAEMLTGTTRDGPGTPISAELEIECLTPAWDARTAASLEPVRVIWIRTTGPTNTTNSWSTQPAR
ncbi:MAG TPA: hypothetical protein VF328_02000 [Mycobacterium sp.]